MAKTLPKVSVIERRLAHPFGAPSVPITLKDGGAWAIRIANDKVRSGRVHQMVGLGWVFVEAGEIDGTPEDFGFRAVKGRLVRGEHGEEVLMKMPQADFDAIQNRKAEINLKNLGSKQTKDAVAQATAVEYGSEAGDTVFKNIDIKDGRERVELEPETT
jgi:hypothetical protein